MPVGSFFGPTRAVQLVCGLCVMAFPHVTMAQEPTRVILVGGGMTFREATEVSLSAWKVRVTQVDAEVPSGSMPQAATDARTIAARYDAHGVVWFTRDGQDYALWIYDARSDQVVAKQASKGPPKDAVTAAATALTVKTLLRASQVAPVEERLGGSAVVNEPIVSVTKSPPPDMKDAPREPLPANSPPSDLDRLRAEIHAGARTIAGRAEARASLGASGYLNDGNSFGAALLVRGGAGLFVQTPRMSGSFSEIGVSAQTRYRFMLTQKLSVEPLAGTTLRFSSVDGTANGQTVGTSRTDLSLDAGGAVETRIDRRLRFGLELTGAYLLRHEVYLVAGQPVLELQPLQGTASLRISVGFM